MIAHTPGPWTITRGHNIKGADGTHVAQILDNDNVMLDDNARLIASAPDLLAALEFLLKTATQGYGIKGDSAIDAAREAIAKAKGETP